MESSETVPAMPGVLFREIHKNGCLKKYSSERRTGFPRRTDRVWAVFCVHDDTEAFLEFYPDHKVALGHKPEWFVSLHNALHVSPSICGQAEEFEFAVTLPTQVVRLAAASWDAMMEWVDTIRNKLRELRVLAPKDNLYSKMPEPRHALLPTRDPTSPLPLPPVGALGLVPGVESPVRPAAAQLTSNPSDLAQLTEDTSSSQGHSQNSQQRSDCSPPSSHSWNEHTPEEESRLSPVTSRAEVAPSTELSRLELTSLPSSSRSNVLPMRQPSFKQSGSPQSEFSHVSSSAVSEPFIESGSRRDFEGRKENQQQCGSSVVVVTDETPRSPAAVEGGEESNGSQSGVRLLRTTSVPSSSNVTVIEVPPPPSPHYEHLFITNDVLIPAETRAKLERVSSAGLIPRVPSRASRDAELRQTNVESSSRARDRLQASVPSPNGDIERVAVSNPTSKPSEPQLHASIVRVKSMVTKEPSKQTSVVRVVPGGGVSVVSVESPGSSKSVNASAVPINYDIVPPIPAAFQPTPSGLDVRDIPLIGGHQRRRRRSSSSDAGPSQRGLGGADLIRMAPAEAPEAAVVPTPDAPRLTLRETQVCQLRREMAHPGGVRFPLRRKDCFGAIALVDISNAVWVAGWKQREHPMLYNALHIGDQLVSIGDIPVRSAAEAQKLLKGPAGPTVDLVVRRLPLGVVLTLQRPRGGGDVGLIPDTASSGEVSVVPGGAAARCGLPPRTATMDGLSLTTWTLTEVNGRPLNLFCKPSDVTTRLNSVGKELSVLVQPSDFIKLLRKQLKSIRGYKEYLLQ